MSSVGMSDDDKDLIRVYDLFRFSGKVRDKLKRIHGIKRYVHIVSETRCLIVNGMYAVDRRTHLRLTKVAEFIEWQIGERLKLSFTSEAFSNFTNRSFQIEISNASLEGIYQILKFSPDVCIVLKELGVKGCWDMIQKKDVLCFGNNKISNRIMRLRVFKLACFLKKEAIQQGLACSDNKTVDPVKSFSLSTFQSYVRDTAIKSVVGRWGIPHASFVQGWCQSQLNRWIEHLATFPPLVKSRKEFIVYGPTQCGKTLSKAIIAALCKVLKIPCVIVTSGLPQTQELVSKLKSFGVAAVSTKDVQGGEHLRKQKALTTIGILKNGGTLVLPGE